MTAPLTLTLPMPPSVNAAYANVAGVGRVKTAKLKQWIEAAGWQAKTSLPKSRDPLFLGPVGVTIDLERPTARSDLDNRCKAILDLLTVFRVWADDSQVSELHMRWADIEGCQVTVTAVEQAEAPAKGRARA